ncbi:MAG TPA: hypothetical protein VNU96_00240 [Burkholderiales bacterium]|jgi:hypothetical protein|nr:hypothetical protein [Burkholderiales bacterium]
MKRHGAFRAYNEARFPGVVTPVRLPENRGKRDALAEGFRRARGEILVTSIRTA